MALDEQAIVAVIAVAKQAAEVIMQIYNDESAWQTAIKADHTPVTAADLQADRIIQQGLRSCSPYPILSEESIVSYEERQTWECYWLVDPLDGTKEFIAKTDEFSINIALIDQQRPIFGLLYAPVTQDYYFAYQQQAYHVSADGIATKLQTRQLAEDENMTVTISRRHGREKMQRFTNKFSRYDTLECGSALKFGLIASGKADLYSRFGPSSEWDTAAGQCIVEAAGGKVMNLQGDVLQYNTKSSLLNPEFIAVGDAKYPWLIE